MAEKTWTEELEDKVWTRAKARAPVIGGNDADHKRREAIIEEQKDLIKTFEHQVTRYQLENDILRAQIRSLQFLLLGKSLVFQTYPDKPRKLPHRPFSSNRIYRERQDQRIENQKYGSWNRSP
jgi:hypothetical protein